MASNFDIEAPTTLGYIDNNAYADGKPLSAHTTRTACINSNKLVRRSQTALCAPFQHCSTGNLGAKPYYGRTLVRPWWQPIFPPMLIRYRPGAVDGTCYMHIGLTGNPAQFRVTTRATRGPQISLGDTSAVYTKDAGDFDTATFPLVLHPDGVDELLIECIGTNYNTRATLGGTTYSGNGVISGETAFTDSAANWSLDSTGSSHASYGHIIRFAALGLAQHSTYHAITNVATATVLSFWPPRDMITDMDYADFEIFDAPIANIAGVLVVANYDNPA